MTRGERNCVWVETHCYFPNGRKAGKRVKLLPFQRADLLALYDNPHVTRTMILSYARKNAKTFFAALIVLLHLVGPEARPNGQIYSAARSRDQASIVYGFARDMVKMSPSLSPYVGIRDNLKELYCPDMGTQYKALSAEAKTKLGLLPEVIIHDELGQVEGPTDTLTEALETATAASEQPLSIVISTQASRDTDLLSIMIDDAITAADPRTVLRLYTAPLKTQGPDGQEIDADPFTIEALKAANPGYGTIQSETELLRMMEEARRMPSKEASFRNLVLNQRVETFAPFISKEVWLACAGDVGEPPKGCRQFLGLDLSEVNDLTAMIQLWLDDDVLVVKPYFWLPAKGIKDRSERDKVPYDIWAKQGHIELIEGASINYGAIAPSIVTMQAKYKFNACGFDRWNWRHFERELIDAELPSKELAKWKPVGQGSATMSPVLRIFETALLNRTFRHGNNPVLNMCMSNAIVSSKDASNRKLEKKKSKGRIDGAVAICDAIAAMLEDDAPTKKPGPLIMRTV